MKPKKTKTGWSIAFLDDFMCLLGIMVFSIFNIFVKNWVLSVVIAFLGLSMFIQLLTNKKRFDDFFKNQGWEGEE